MKCDSCGMTIKKKPIREEAGGQVRYYCCLNCFEEDICRRDKPLRKALPARSRTRRSVRGRRGPQDTRSTHPVHAANREAPTHDP